MKLDKNDNKKIQQISKEERQPREITSTTYKRSQKRLQKNLNCWFGRGMEKF